MKDNISAFNSKEYDNKIKQTVPYYEEFYKQVVDVVKFYRLSNLSWLDTGCGTGKMAEIAMKKFNIARYVFCDISSEMVEIAKQRFPLSYAEFVVGSTQELNYNREFDVVTAIQVNHYAKWDDRVIAIEKCYDALKDNGIFITFENFAPYSDAGKDLFLERWKEYQVRQGKSKAESQKHVDRYGLSYYPISISEHLDIMRKCGFKAVEILWASYMQVGLLGIK